MKNTDHIRKGLAYVIILLFVGTSFSPIMSGDFKPINDIEEYSNINLEENKLPLPTLIGKGLKMYLVR